jgi:hypothetical protein
MHQQASARPFVPSDSFYGDEWFATARPITSALLYGKPLQVPAGWQLRCRTVESRTLTPKEHENLWGAGGLAIARAYWLPQFTSLSS